MLEFIVYYIIIPFYFFQKWCSSSWSIQTYMYMSRTSQNGMPTSRHFTIEGSASCRIMALGSWNIFGLQSKFQSFIKLKITLICNYQHNMCMETHFQSFSFPPCFQSQGNKTVNKFWLSLKLRHDHWAWTYRVWHSLVRSCLLRY